MPDAITEKTPVAPEAAVDTTAGHLSVHLPDLHPTEVPFLFGVTRQRSAGAAWASAGWHALVVLAVILVVRYAPEASYQANVDTRTKPNEHIVWIAEPGPGGGGGGGGNQQKELPRLAQLPGKDKISVPVMKKPDLMALNKPQPQKPETPPPPQQLDIPAKTIESSPNQMIAGVIDGPSSPTGTSLGPGSGGGAGSGSGGGIGPGQGDGLGPGFGGGTGGGVHQPGSGVSTPTTIREVKPLYTPDAMRAKIQGVVVLDCVVRPDGTVGDVQVSHSLDPVFGLDNEAIKAAKQWRFTPGILKATGQPVSVQVSIEMTFTLR